MKLSALAAAAAVSVALLAGCGGDNSSSVATSPPTTGSASASTAASSATTSGSAQNNSSTTTPTFSGNANSEFCSIATDLSNGSLVDSLESSGDLKTSFSQLQQTLQQAYDKAPSEIKNDVGTVQAAFKSVSDLLAQYDYDFTKIEQAATEDPSILQKLQGPLDDQKVTDATTRITAYAEQVCGVQDTSDTTS